MSAVPARASTQSSCGHSCASCLQGCMCPAGVLTVSPTLSGLFLWMTVFKAHFFFLPVTQ